MAFVKGQSGNPAGKPKGAKNGDTQALKNAILGALNAGDGAKAYFMRLKEERPELFTPLVAKLIPKDVNVDVRTEKLIRVIDHTGVGPVIADVAATRVEPEVIPAELDG